MRRVFAPFNFFNCTKNGIALNDFYIKYEGALRVELSYFTYTPINP